MISFLSVPNSLLPLCCLSQLTASSLFTTVLLDTLELVTVLSISPPATPPPGTLTLPLVLKSYQFCLCSLLPFQVLIISSLDDLSILLTGAPVFSPFSLKSILPTDGREVVLKFIAHVIPIANPCDGSPLLQSKL